MNPFRNALALSCFFAFSLPLFAQTGGFRVAGYVLDSLNGERLIGASLYQKGSKGYTFSNEYGFFTLQAAQESPVVLEVAYVGYRAQQIEFSASKDTIVYIYLAPAALLQEVEIRSERNAVKNTDGSVLVLSSSQIKALPRLLGEADALRAFQLLPGVQSGSEGSSALHVRGGSPDQNLIVLDDVPLYFVNHLGGFLSVIDANSVSAIKLYKGGFPARYAGRLSSILDVRLKDGNNQQWNKEFSIGILSSRLSFSGPIVRGKSSVLVTVRRSNFDYLSRVRTLFQGQDKFSAGFWFYDATLKANWNLGRKDRLLLSFYSGADDLFLHQRQKSTIDGEVFSTAGKADTHWGNLGAGLRWNHVFSERLFSNFIVSYTGFRYKNGLSAQRRLAGGADSLVSSFSNALRSRIQDVACKGVFEWHPSQRTIFRYGGGLILHAFRQPGIEFSQTGATDIPDSYGGAYLPSVESGVFGEAEGRLNNRMEYNIGLHLAALSVGAAWFFSPQPRLSLAYKPSKTITAKASYARMTQNLHLLSNAGAGLPTDLWVPATPTVRPATSDQISLGISTELPLGMSLEIEGYYKKMIGLIEFQQGASFASSGGDWQQKVEKNGIGKAYGIEFLLRKAGPKLEGWLSYTLSSNKRQFANLNNGRPFPYKFDRPHVLHLVGISRFSERFTMSGTWTFETGQAITLPNSAFPVETFGQAPSSVLYGFYPGTAYLFEGRNNFRLPNYHRLDISFNFSKKFRRKGKSIERTWSIGAYNLYNQQNPYFVYYDKNEQGQTRLYQITMFPLLPFANLEYKF